AWPGNVRELRNFVEQAVLLEKSDRLDPQVVSSLLQQRTQRRDQTPVVPILVGTKVVEAERQLAERTLEAYRGDRAAAAHALGVGVERRAELLGEAVPHPIAPSG